MCLAVCPDRLLWHAAGHLRQVIQPGVDSEGSAGVRAQGVVSNMLEENVVQPLLVTVSALNLATECVRMILKVTP